MKEPEIVVKESVGRKTLLAGLGLGLLSLFSLWKTSLFTKKTAAIGCAPGDQKGTMKVLSQDGKLVEVNISDVRRLKQKISDKELREWVKKL